MMPYVTETGRRAIMADRERAARPLVDLIARERLDLAVRPAGVGRSICIDWRPDRLARAIQSIATPLNRRPRAMTKECV